MSDNEAKEISGPTLYWALQIMGRILDFTGCESGSQWSILSTRVTYSELHFERSPWAAILRIDHRRSRWKPEGSGEELAAPWQLGAGTWVSSGFGEKWSKSEDILKVEPTGFADGLDVECERRPGIEDESEAFGL